MMTIGGRVAVDGNVSCDEDLTIEGTVTGLVLVRSGTLIVGRGAQVRADLRAPRVIVRGVVEGAIGASERIELTATASVEGALSASRIAIADGARFNGPVDMGRRFLSARVAEYRAAQPAEP